MVALATGLWDPELGALCQFADDGAGRYRCAPPTTGSVAYLDSACTVPVVRFFGGLEPSAFALEEIAFGECASQSVVRPVLERLPTPPSEVFVLGTAGCASRAVAIDPYYALGPSLEPSLVAGRRQLVGSGRLQQWVDKGEDGSHLCGGAAGLVDSALEVDCSARTASEGSHRCLPESRSLRRGYSDNLCSGPTRAVADPTCDPTRFATEMVELSCSGGAEADVGFRVFEAGERRSAPFFFGFSDRCIPSLTPMRDIGAEIPAGDFEAFRFESAGSGRLRARLLVAAGEAGVGIEVGDWLDSHLGGPCEARSADDGRLRCLPSAAPRVLRSLFADDRCTTPAPALALAEDACPAKAQRYAMEALEEATWRVYETAGLRPTAVYRLADTECVAVSDPVYDLGPALGAASFVALNVEGGGPSSRESPPRAEGTSATPRRLEPRR